ncbi:MAG: hypothetical protein EP343_19220 [Deltaproteobacteria bacterium]|nr:MAG: hypothetical protein EP343_19220 [Deltaproteobacteria bacterium]
MFVRNVWFGLIVGLVLCAAHDNAEACSPPRPGILSVSVFPPNGTKNVPTNARINVRYNYVKGGAFSETFSIRPFGGANLAVTPQQVSVGNWERRFFFLKGHLQPNTTYEVVTNIQAIPCFFFGGNPGCTTGSPQVISTFTTGTSDDTKPPSFAGLQSIVPVKSPSVCSNSACCGPYHYHRFDVNWTAGTDETEASFVLYNIYRTIDLSKPVLRYVPQSRGAQVCSGFYFGLSWDSFRGLPGGYVVRAVDLADNEETNTNSVNLVDLCSGPEPVVEPSPEPRPEPSSEPESELSLPEEPHSMDKIMEGPYEPPVEPNSPEPGKEASKEPTPDSEPSNSKEESPTNKEPSGEPPTAAEGTTEDASSSESGTNADWVGNTGCQCNAHSSGGALWWCLMVLLALVVFRRRTSSLKAHTSGQTKV